MLDTDHDGFVSSSEIGKLLRSVGLNPTEAEIKEMIAEIDKNGTK